MPRGRPKLLSGYEKTKAKKIRSFLSEQNNTRFDGLHDSALLNTILISDGRVFVSLDHHDAVIGKIAKFIDEVKSV
ncbi:MAG: hypothetical protein WCX22_03270 [Methanoregula sp.]